MLSMFAKFPTEVGIGRPSMALAPPPTPIRSKGISTRSPRLPASPCQQSECAISISYNLL